MDRRSFLGMTGAGLALPGLGVATTSCDGGSFIELSLSGLFAMELWDPPPPPAGQDPKKFTKLAFVDGEKTLGVAHGAMLIAHLEDCLMPGQVDFPEPSESHRPAQIIRVGDSVFGMWSLTDYALWIDLGPEGKEEKRYPTDDHGDFDFPITKDSIAQGPNPRDQDAGWAGRQWFLDMGDILGAPVDELDSSRISARVLIRHGQAAGVAPMTLCERVRKYYFDKKENARAVAAEIKVRHPANPAQKHTDFRVAPLSPGSSRTPDTGTDGAIIRLRTSPGRTTKVAIVNVPLFSAMSPAALMGNGAGTQTCEHDHFQAYFKLVHADLKCLRVVEGMGENTKSCPEPGSYRNPSEAGCTPCIIKRA
jgi:hypothetical protein